MKKITLTQFAFISLLSATTLFTACKKDADSVSEEEIQQARMTTEADAEADVLYNDVFDNVMGVNDDLGMGGGIGVFGSANGISDDGNTGIFSVDSVSVDSVRCFTTTISPQQVGVFPKTVTLDFGTGCTGRDGKTRRGKITTVYTGRMVVPGSRATTTFDNYYVDSVKVEGTHITQNNSTSTHRIFSVKVEQGKLTRPGGDNTQWNKTKTWTQTDGNGTPHFPVDDVYNITGHAHGTVTRGSNTAHWSSEILQPIVRKFTCRWAVAGEKKVTRNTRTFVLNYGNGSCDNQATITINGNVHNITLR